MMLKHLLGIRKGEPIAQCPFIRKDKLTNWLTIAISHFLQGLPVVCTYIPKSVHNVLGQFPGTPLASSQEPFQFSCTES